MARAGRMGRITLPAITPKLFPSLSRSMRTHLPPALLAISLVTLGLLCPSVGKASGQVPICPSELPTASVTISPPPGYLAHLTSPLPLKSAGLMYGPPSSMTISVPSSARDHRNSTTRTWEDLEHVNEKWMACFYGTDHDVILSQQIDPRVKSCKVVVTQVKGRASPQVAISCSW